MEEHIRKVIREHFPRQQREIADAAGLSQAFMSEWMNGKTRISVDRFEAICFAIGISWKASE